MKEAALIDKLMLFGMTRQEASIYLCLAANNELSGYEISKITGISRSNVYNSLSTLVEKGATYLMEGNTNKYLAVDIEEFCENKIRHMQEAKEELINEMPRAGNSCDGYITISNHRNIMDRIKYLLKHVMYRVYISMPLEFLEKFRDDINTLIEQEKKVVLIVNGEADFEGAIIYKTDNDEKQIRLIIDSEYVLTGDMSGNSSDVCLYTGQKNFVNVFKESLRNEIKLIELLKNER